MLTDITVRHFRGLKAFAMPDLARVNLVVGGNNAGKTSLLEAAAILLSGSPLALLEAFQARQEYLSPKENLEVDICHLFHGHQLEQGAAFEILASDTNKHVTELRYRVVEQTGSKPLSVDQSVPDIITDQDAFPLWALHLQGTHFSEPITINLSAEGGMLLNEWRQAYSEFKLTQNVILRRPTPNISARLQPLWDKLVLTPDEDFVIEALRIIEPGIERIAAIGGRPTGRFVMSMRNGQTRMPMGSMGDGIRHLFALAISLAGTKDGYLLVDEIDTGLHYSVLGKLWTLLIETARRLNVQVIATTHSLDCLQALAAVCEANSTFVPEVAVHRMEKGAEKAITYSAKELQIAINREMEIR